MNKIKTKLYGSPLNRMNERFKPFNPQRTMGKLPPDKLAKPHKALEKTSGFNRNQRFYQRFSNEWKKLRKEFLSQNLFCAMCLKKNKFTKATQCDHIRPFGDDVNLFFDYNNLQALCFTCHSKKTHHIDKLMKERIAMHKRKAIKQ